MEISENIKNVKKKIQGSKQCNFTPVLVENISKEIKISQSKKSSKDRDISTMLIKFFSLTTFQQSI